MSISDQKKALRKTMFEARNGIDAEIKKDYDAWVCSELEKIIINRNCKVVHSYIPFLNEINIIPLIKKLLEKKIVVVSPKTLPRRKLENRILNSLEDLEIGIMGTKHPAQQNIFEGSYDLIIVPGLAYDASKYRLGYGGGYYDNFLITQPQACKVGVFYPVQKVDAVPTEAHDISLDVIVVKKF